MKKPTQYGYPMHKSSTCILRLVMPVGNALYDYKSYTTTILLFYKR